MVDKKLDAAAVAKIHQELRATYGPTVTRQELFDYRDKTGIYPVWIRRDDSLRVGRGTYKVPPDNYVPGSIPRVTTAPRAVPTLTPRPMADDVLESASDPGTTSSVLDRPMAAVGLDASALKSLDVHTRMELIRQQASLLARVPSKDPAFVPFGDYEMVLSVVESGKFFPIFIAGLSGNGKTFQVQQACARSGREYVRVNITAETDEDDLLGGFRLVDGNTVFELGPVVVAMIRGAVLLIDEIDYASPKIACIQSVLEGKEITLKKLGITISPTPGFNVFATANTKGRGDETGQFHGANLLNEAFLDRFPITVEQDYPDVKTERKILVKNFRAAGYQMTPHAKVYFDTLARWAEAIRQTYHAGGVESLIATRRLVHIVSAYGLFGGSDDPNNGADAKAVAYCLNRFDPKTKDSFIDLYNKLAPDAAAPTNVGTLDDDDDSDS